MKRVAGRGHDEAASGVARTEWFLAALFSSFRATSERARLQRKIAELQAKLGELPDPAPPPSRTERATVWVLRKVFRVKFRD